MHRDEGKVTKANKYPINYLSFEVKTLTENYQSFSFNFFPVTVTLSHL